MPAGLALGAAAPLFEEVPSWVSGIAWTHENAMSPNRYLPETMGPGVAFVDYDNDGRIDVLIGNNGGAPVLLKNNVGIGTASKVDWIEIKWPAPSGRVERLTDVPIDRYVTIVEGQGRIKA